MTLTASAQKYYINVCRPLVPYGAARKSKIKIYSGCNLGRQVLGQYCWLFFKVKKSQSKVFGDSDVISAPEGKVDCGPDFHLLGR